MKLECSHTTLVLVTRRQSNTFFFLLQDRPLNRFSYQAWLMEYSKTDLALDQRPNQALLLWMWMNPAFGLIFRECHPALLPFYWDVCHWLFSRQWCITTPELFLLLLGPMIFRFKKMHLSVSHLVNSVFFSVSAHFVHPEVDWWLKMSE